MMYRENIVILSTVSSLLLVGCSHSSSIQSGASVNTDKAKSAWDLPLDPVPATSLRMNTQAVQTLEKPLTLADMEEHTGRYLARKHGMAGEKVRSFTETASKLKRRGELLANIDSRHQELLVVEHKGNFTSQLNGKEGGETYPYAMLVVNAQTGELVSRSLYAERYRPR